MRERELGCFFPLPLSFGTTVLAVAAPLHQTVPSGSSLHQVASFLPLLPDITRPWVPQSPFLVFFALTTPL